MDVTQWFQGAEGLSARTASRVIGALEGSDILRISGEIQQRQAAGHAVANLTIGDFDPKIFPIPPLYAEAIVNDLRAGQTNYPPAVGVPELRSAIRSFYAARLGLEYPDGCILVGSGARPPIYGAFRAILDPGDLVVYPVPTWNVRYYVQMAQADEAVILTTPENGFMPTVDQVLPHLRRARMLVLNSPLNPAGTVIDPGLLKDLTQLVVDENRRREAHSERPLFLLFDQVYWQLTFGCEHVSPVTLVPESARYVIHVDAVSKCWAATGLRVGWAVCPPWVRDRMQPLIGHMGAWAARAEQRATARMLAEPELLDPWMNEFKGRVEGLLVQLADGLNSMRDEGLPVSCLAPQGAIYLSAHFGEAVSVAARRENPGIQGTDEALRAFLLQRAGLGVVPFTAFGTPDGTGWIRISVGTTTPETVSAALDRLRTMLRSL
jgi:aspartate aminotransferase